MNSKLKWTFGIVGTVILGAIGSGVWRLLLEPFSLWIGKALFTVATLGLESLRNGVYAEVAKGLHESPSLSVFCLLLLLPLFALSSFIGVMLGQKKARHEIEDSISRIETENPDPQSRSNEISKMLNEGANTARRHAVRAIIPISIVIIVFCFFQLFTAVYVNRAITHFQQCLNICNPYLTDAQEEEILSQFNRISSRADYAVIVQQLEHCAESSGVKCASFQIF